MTGDTTLHVREIKTLAELGDGLHHMRSHETPAEAAVAFSRKFGRLPEVVLVCGECLYMPMGAYKPLKGIE
jgi:hypothetical protein